MWVTTHVLAGLAIAAALGGPWWLVLVAVIVAHVVMDLIPHWDYTKTTHPVLYGWCDFLAGLILWLVAWLVLGMPFWLAFMGPVASRMCTGSRAIGSASRTGAPAAPGASACKPCSWRRASSSCSPPGHTERPEPARPLRRAGQRTKRSQTAVSGIG
jgi:uncharacterized membrane protein